MKIYSPPPVELFLRRERNWFQSSRALPPKGRQRPPAQVREDARPSRRGRSPPLLLPTLNKTQRFCFLSKSFQISCLDVDTLSTYSDETSELLSRDKNKSYSGPRHFSRRPPPVFDVECRHIP